MKIGLAGDPRTRLTKFYKKHNTKMRDVRKYGNETERNGTAVRRVGLQKRGLQF